MPIQTRKEGRHGERRNRRRSSTTGSTTFPDDAEWPDGKTEPDGQQRPVEKPRATRSSVAPMCPQSCLHSRA
jgi:hypothetical protein